ncbi:TetR/AcrR family transcriptional regulator [Streptacidiphilus jiangxiensis]|uniref:Regulatory protein, tetR family n=1 Tax=Streptacidiphilus jiangxiensis TaxID=235985 RepID=A0A1H7Z9C7_STRJI|nr:TetR/AcrR family transcriptional regulator [Streptacidiphilus jiangxiensis]SEM54865.1 regulatory protein, tetR family [Streptacidiphilus jiangxiensis]
MSDTRSAARARYHHGDLANALAREAEALAREGGPEAVVLREAARRAGVSAAAAYRHFSSHEELLRAAKERGHELLAEALEAAMPPAAGPRERLRALGAAYVGFAVAEPGLFRTAFCHGARELAVGPDALGEYRAFRIVADALDALLAAGLMPAALRPGAEFPAWAALHGLALLTIDGPLAVCDAPTRAAMLEATLDLVERGLTG